MRNFKVSKKLVYVVFYVVALTVIASFTILVNDFLLMAGA